MVNIGVRFLSNQQHTYCNWKPLQPDLAANQDACSDQIFTQETPPEGHTIIHNIRRFYTHSSPSIADAIFISNAPMHILLDKQTKLYLKE